MFNFLKEKFSALVKAVKGKASEKEKIEKKQEKAAKKLAKPAKKPQEKQKQKEAKIEKRIRSKEELKEERKTTHEVLQDIKKEKLEIKTPEEKYEEVEKAREEEIKETEEEEEKPGFFARLKKKFTTITFSEEDFNELWQDFELSLLENNVALEVVDKIQLDLRKSLINVEIKKDEVEKKAKAALSEVLSDVLINPFKLEEKIEKKLDRPFIILFFGINGSGKTTTIAKLAFMLKKHFSVVLAAGDTFRAASIEQLSQHASKLDVPIIKKEYGSDPASVAFEAVQYAKKSKIDIVLVDTAGRMHTQENLMREMEKISRVVSPDLKIFIAESITGNDATQQAKSFSESIGLDAIILSKADIDEKAGTILSVGYVTGKPILFLGVGQEYKDLEQFDKTKFLKNLGLS